MKSLIFLFHLSLLIIAPLHAKTILVLGDSLSAAYGIDYDKGWVSLLTKQLSQKGDYKVINLSTSGDTTSNGLAKLEPALKQYQPELVIIELGANDGLRGLTISHIKKNLETMIQLAQKQQAKVLLLATWLPPNYGPQFLDQFKNIYSELASAYKVAIIPMFLEGVAGNDQLMQSDGLHPNEKAQPLILKNIWPQLARVLQIRN